MSRHVSTVSTQDNAADLRICLFGSPRVAWAGELLTVRRRQVRALLYRLAAQLRPIPREKLCFLFWPDKPESNARRNFRRLLSSLRRELPAPDIILTPGDRVALDAEGVWSDTTAFDNLRASTGSTSPMDNLRTAVGLYRGAFLTGFSLKNSHEYEAWVSQTQYAWERRYLETLAELIDIEMVQSEYDHAIAHARQYLVVDELAEDVHRRLIELYAASGDRSAALEQYEQCAVVLERELGVDPLPETQAVYQAVQEGTLVQRVVLETEPTWTTLPGLDVPLVGRDEALRQLEVTFAAAQSGRAGVVLISGEAGIGKSRLMEEFASRHEHKALVLTGAGYPDTGTMPYLPVLEALRSVVDLRETAVQLEEAWLAEAAHVLPELRSLAPDPPSDARRSSDEARRRLFEALSRLTLALSTDTHPVLLCLDDLHWADPTTLEWLAYLGRRLPGSRLLIVGICRTEEADALRDLRHNLNRSIGVTEVLLTPLDTASVSQILSHLDGRVGDEALAARLRQTTGGNPFFLLELLRALLQSDQGLEELARRDVLPLSDSVRSAVEAHLSRLSRRSRQVLEAGAVLGPRFSFELVHRTAGRGEMETVDGLDELVSRQVLTERPTGYRFRHETLRTVVYEDLTLGRRRLLHRRAGEALETLRIDDATALAHHFERAGPQQTEKAVAYLLQAGREARRLSANEEAIELVTKGLELIETLPDTPERTQQELDLQVTLALALRDTKGYSASEVEQAYARAHELCRQVGETPQLFRVLWGLWAFYLVRGEYHRAREPAEECLTLAQHMDDPALLVEAHRLLGSIFLWLGELAPARTHLEQVLHFYNPEEHRSHAFRYGQDPAIAARSYGAWTLWLLGYPNQALQWSQEAITLAQELSHPYSLAYAYTMAPWMRGSRREARVVQEQAEKAIVLCDEQGFALLLAWGTILRGWALAEQGQAEEGIAQMREGLSECRAMSSQIVQPYFLALLAEAYAKAGQAEEGLAVVADAMAGVRERGDRFYEAELHRLKGEQLLALSAENRTEAEACFRQSIDVARQQQAKSLELRAVMSFYRLLQQQGRSEEGRQMVSEVYNWFTEGFDTLDLVEARELLEECGAP